jgi:putative acetyltransferase
MATQATLRTASDQDGPQIRSLVFGILEEYGLRGEPGAKDADLASVVDSYIAPGGAFEVMVVGERVIGTLGLFRMQAHECELRKMYLHADFRGLGLGKKLLQHGIETARSLGFCTIMLETIAPLREAIGLYHAFGFRDVPIPKVTPRADRRMQLDLD